MAFLNTSLLSALPLACLHIRSFFYFILEFLRVSPPTYPYNPHLYKVRGVDDLSQRSSYNHRAYEQMLKVLPSSSLWQGQSASPWTFFLFQLEWCYEQFGRCKVHKSYRDIDRLERNNEGLVSRYIFEPHDLLSAKTLIKARIRKVVNAKHHIDLLTVKLSTQPNQSQKTHLYILLTGISTAVSIR